MILDVMKAIAERRSIRAYKDAPVTKEQLMTVLEAVRLAPSWKDKQCWSVVVVSGRERIRQLGVLLRNNPGASVFETVPYFLVFVADPSKSGNREDKPYYMTDIGICMQNAVLAARELGLGTCWIGAFTEEPIKKFLGIPEELRIVALTPLGVPAENPDMRPRMEISEFVFDNEWGKKL
jgi:nitroreductase